MKLSYKQRIFGVIFIVFAIFSICIIISEQAEERKIKTEALENKLDSYVEIIHQYIENQDSPLTDSISISAIISVLPSDLRITLIDADGTVFYENDSLDIHNAENHISRPEVMKAQYQDYGANIRMSASTHHEYMYYAKFFSRYYIRVALPYNIEVKSALQSDNYFIYIVIVLFIVFVFFLNIVASRFNKSLNKLRDIVYRLKNDLPMPQEKSFPDDELGSMEKELVSIFKLKEEDKETIEKEKEKLIQHLQYSSTGLGIFSEKKEKIYTNSHFLQNINQIVDKPIFDIDFLFENPALKNINDFLAHRNADNKYLIYQAEKNGKTFTVQIIVFEDNSFELTIKDITKVEKNRLLKQEMTNNIAHELRTPVTSLRGFLETLHNNNLDKERQQQFIERAYLQSIRLSNLIQDISLLSKIEEVSSKFEMERIALSQIVNEVRIDLTERLKENNIKLNIEIKPETVVLGNRTLLYSIFRNLMDNSISYAGQGIDIHIKDYMEDSSFVYISYYDTGKGVDEQHMPRLFERFYRVNEGRTRDTGGSGLGLSIVKNAITLHKGEIHARKFSKGGLEFLFTLHK